MSDVSLTVLDDMRLLISPEEIARHGEHNSATCKIVKQPVSLDPYSCRAEVETASGTTYRAVSNGEFSLTNDIAVNGIGRMQLVYSDGVDVMRKTSTAQFRVSGSINAVDESDPTFQDGLAQLQSRAFANVTYEAGTGLLAFYNLGMSPLDSVMIAGGAGGVPEVPASPNGAYARTRSTAGTDWVDFTTLGVAGLYSPEFQGAPTAPTPVAGDSTLRLATTQYVYRDFLPRGGGQMMGPLIAASGGSLTNMGLAVGDNSTGWYRTGNVVVMGVSGAFTLQYTVDAMMMAVQIVMGNQRITTLADATSDQDAMNRRSADARYLQPIGADARYVQLAGSAMTGTLTTKPGTGANDLGIAIGDGATGFCRNGAGSTADLMALMAGFPMLVLTSTREAVIGGPLSLSGNRIFNLADATQPTDALNRQSGDARYLQSAGGTMDGVMLFAPTQGLGFQPGYSALYEAPAPYGLTIRQALGNLGVFIEGSDGTPASRRRILTTDDGRAPSLVVELPASQTFTSATFVNLFPITYPIPRGGNSRIMVSVMLDCALPGDSQIAVAGIVCSNALATIRKAFLYQLNGACSGVAVQFVFDVAGTSVGPFNVQCANLSTGPGGGAASWTALAGSQAVVTDMGPR